MGLGGITMVKTMLKELSDQAEQHRIKKILANISPDQYILKLDEERRKYRKLEKINTALADLCDSLMGFARTFIRRSVKDRKALHLAYEELADHLLVEEASEEQRLELVDYLVGEFREKVKSDGKHKD